MAYASAQDAISLYGTDYVTVACDRDRTGTLDTDAFEVGLVAASAMIDGYFAGRVPGWPWASVPPNLVKLTVDLALYICASTGRDVLTEHMIELNREALKYLMAVGKGQLRLTQEGAAQGAELNLTATATSSKENQALLTCGSRKFVRGQMGSI